MNKDSSQDEWIQPDGIEGLVSVVIPTHDRPELVVQTIRSIFSQSYRPIEILVVEDGSSDATASAMEALTTEAPDGIELHYEQQTNAGAPAARNRGARNSKGQFIVFMDDDDLFASDCFSSHIAAFQSQSNASMSYGRWKRFMRKEDHYNILDYMGDLPPAARTPWEAFLMSWDLLLQSCMMKRSLVSQAGPWRIDLKKSQDLDYKARLLGTKSCQLVDSPNSLVYYRIHKASITGTMTPDKLRSYMNGFDIVKEITTSRKDYEDIRMRFADYLWGQYYWLTGHGQHAAAWEMLKWAKTHDRRVSKRNGSLPARLLANVGLDRVSGPLLYVLFRLKNKLAKTPEPFLERVDSLPGTGAH